MSIFRYRQRRIPWAESGLATYRPRGPKGGTACSPRGRISGGTNNRWLLLQGVGKITQTSQRILWEVPGGGDQNTKAWILQTQCYTEEMVQRARNRTDFCPRTERWYSNLGCKNGSRQHSAITWPFWFRQMALRCICQYDACALGQRRRHPFQARRVQEDVDNVSLVVAKSENVQAI